MKNPETYVDVMFCADQDETPPKTPRDIKVVQSGKDIAVQLNNVWHSRLPEIRNPHGGLYFVGIYKNRYFFSAIWTLPVAANRLKHGFHCLELRRYAIASDAPRNTATYGLARMRKQIAEQRPDVYKLVSYQDTEVHLGTIYKADNWTLTNTQKTFVDWKSNEPSWKKRRRGEQQAQSAKNRWEKIIGKEPEEKSQSETQKRQIEIEL